MSSISDVPGPFAASFTRLWHIFCIAAGDQNLRLIQLHDKLGAPIHNLRGFPSTNYFAGNFVRISYDEVSVSHPDAVKKLYMNPVPKGYWYKGTALPDYRFVAPMSVCDPKAKVELSKALSPPYSQSEYEALKL